MISSSCWWIEPHHSLSVLNREVFPLHARRWDLVRIILPHDRSVIVEGEGTKLILQVPIFQGGKKPKLIETTLDLDKLEEVLKDLIRSSKSLSYCGFLSHNLDTGRNTLLNALRKLLDEKDLKTLWKECFQSDNSVRWPQG